MELEESITKKTSASFVLLHSTLVSLVVVPSDTLVLISVIAIINGRNVHSIKFYLMLVKYYVFIE